MTCEKENRNGVYDKMVVYTYRRGRLALAARQPLLVLVMVLLDKQRGHYVQLLQAKRTGLSLVFVVGNLKSSALFQTTEGKAEHF